MIKSIVSWNVDPIQIVLQTAIEPMQAVLPIVLVIKTARTDVMVVRILSAKVGVNKSG